MDSILKTTAVQSLLCLIGINNPLQCMVQGQGVNWKTDKARHFDVTKNKNGLLRTTVDFKYWANDLANDRHFADQLEAILIPRTVGSEGHRKVRGHIIRQMEGLGWTVETDSFRDNKAPSRYRNHEFTNVIATLNPRAPRRMVLACHYDSKIEPPGFVAATDSAVPCAQMINLAKTMKRELDLFREQELTLQFLFLDGEEAFIEWNKNSDAIYGSRNLAEKWDRQTYRSGGVSGTQLDRIDIFVLLDLIGAKQDMRGGSMTIRQLERTTENWFNRLYEIEDQLLSKNLMRGSPIFKPGYFPAGIEDDHIPFKTRDVPILHLIAYPFPKHWHKIGDNKQSLDFKKISNLNKILRVFVAEYLHLL